MYAFSFYYLWTKQCIYFQLKHFSSLRSYQQGPPPIVRCQRIAGANVSQGAKLSKERDIMV